MWNTAFTNHEIQLGHLTMDKQLKAKIAVKLHEGVTEKNPWRNSGQCS